MPNVAPSAFIEPGAQVADDVIVGPGCYVGAHVQVGAGCQLMPNVTLLGHSRIGERNTMYPGCVLGAVPQDLKYRGGDTRLIVGNGNVFREHVTVHLGTEVGGDVTSIGNHNQFQVGSHLAHDVRVGNHCVVSNCVQVAGHVYIEDYVNISGMVGVQQFVTIGKYSFIGGAARCTTDVPPFLVIAGFDGAVVSVNEEGMRRWGFEEAQISGIWELYKTVYSKKAGRAGGTIADRIARAESNGPLDEHQRCLLEFVKRSLRDGVWGRYLESRRGDAGSPTPTFYKVSSP